MKPEYIILHHSASPITQTAETINEYHRKKWNFKSALGGYAGYQYIIEHDGRVTQWRKDTERGAHTIGRNDDSIGICIVGWFDDGHDSLPTPEQQEALRELIEKKRKEYKIGLNDVKFHRDFTEKSCPGYHITKDWLYNLLGNNMKNQDFYDDKRKAQGWSSVEDWVGAAKEYKDERDKLRKEKEEFSKKIKQLETSLEDTEITLGKTKANYEEIVARLKREKSESEATIKDLNKSLRKKESKIQNLKNTKDSLEKKIEQEKKQLKKEIENLRTETQDCEEALSSKSQKISKLHKQIKEKEQELQKTEYSLADLILMIFKKLKK
jgi:DNA repair exonuclease SbcCD ATPase subunit